ncbi:MAG TPA: DEAD/DEAH box helicase [Paenibacillus sp.]|uniref:DEAD/DEAH box helicase n=1 Tax=Paenibacillus sp. TaxID=58172 RepID=UPI002CB40B3D|nr:DEAD/DEAH box helicase [Paenibacillus sp.]HUC91260.1 DEAD/DEAH box helicase [Paenibacillus sp.]
MTTPFDKLGIRAEVTEQLRLQGLTNPTPVQKSAIPHLLAGRDAIVQAQTGTGKTLAFALPILNRIDPNNNNVQALVVTPTRELAIQITQEFKKLKDAVGANVLAAYGGQDVDAQIRKLDGRPQIVVGTPGRLLDHLRRRTIRLSELDVLVLDEADQMLHMGFLAEVEELIAQTPESRQTVLLSATMPDSVRRLARRYMREPEDVTIRTERVTLDSIRQIAVDTTDRSKQPTLIRLLETYRPYLAVIFCRTKIRAAKLNEALLEHGFQSDELHGELTQAKREQVMKRFRDAKLQLLVCTDVAARGIDVEGVTHVFNYDIPQDAEWYIHRIGRTGRAGQRGVAVTLVTPRDRSRLDGIERAIDARLERKSMSEFGVGAAADDDEAAQPALRASRGSRAGVREDGRGGARGAGKRSGTRGEARSDAAGARGRGGAGRGETRGYGRDGGRSDARGAGRGGAGFAERGEAREAGRGASRSDARGSGRDSAGFAGRSEAGGLGRGPGRSDARGGSRGGTDFAERGAGRGEARGGARSAASRERGTGSASHGAGNSRSNSATGRQRSDRRGGSRGSSPSGRGRSGPGGRGGRSR